jgi:hypothetical protein
MSASRTRRICHRQTGAATRCAGCVSGRFGVDCGSTCVPHPTCQGTTACNQETGDPVSCDACVQGRYPARRRRTSAPKIPPDDFLDPDRGNCEAMQPCGPVYCYRYGLDAWSVARPCPNDPDCFGTADEPALACEIDGHCDSWCPLDASGAPVDPDCSAGGAAYCPGGERADQCE